MRKNVKVVNHAMKEPHDARVHRMEIVTNKALFILIANASFVVLLMKIFYGISFDLNGICFNEQANKLHYGKDAPSFVGTVRKRPAAA